MHRLFFDQLGPWGVWLEDREGRPAGFLLGLVSAAEPDLAYVHMHVVDPAWRGTGAGERLYREFCARAHDAGLHAGARPRGARADGVAALPRAPGLPGAARSRLPGARRRPDRLRAAAAARRMMRNADPPLPSLRFATRARSRMADVIDQEHHDRRAHRREDVRLPARVRFGDTVVDAEAINLSEGGVLLEAEEMDIDEGRVVLAGADFPSAAQVRIEIELAELGWHALDAQVVRVTDGPVACPCGRLRLGGHRGRARGHPGLLPGAPRRLSVSRGAAADRSALDSGPRSADSRMSRRPGKEACGHTPVPEARPGHRLRRGGRGRSRHGDRGRPAAPVGHDRARAGRRDRPPRRACAGESRPRRRRRAAPDGRMAGLSAGRADHPRRRAGPPGRRRRGGRGAARRDHAAGRDHRRPRGGEPMGAAEDRGGGGVDPRGRCGAGDRRGHRHRGGRGPRGPRLEDLAQPGRDGQRERRRRQRPRRRRHRLGLRR